MKFCGDMYNDPYVWYTLGQEEKADVIAMINVAAGGAEAEPDVTWSNG